MVSPSVVSSVSVLLAWSAGRSTHRACTAAFNGLGRDVWSLPQKTRRRARLVSCNLFLPRKYGSNILRSSGSNRSFGPSPRSLSSSRSLCSFERPSDPFRGYAPPRLVLSSSRLHGAQPPSWQISFSAGLSSTSGSRAWRATASLDKRHCSLSLDLSRWSRMSYFFSSRLWLYGDRRWPPNRRPSSRCCFPSWYCTFARELQFVSSTDDTIRVCVFSLLRVVEFRNYVTENLTCEPKQTQPFLQHLANPWQWAAPSKQFGRSSNSTSPLPAHQWCSCALSSSAALRPSGSPTVSVASSRHPPPRHQALCIFSSNGRMRKTSRTSPRMHAQKCGPRHTTRLRRLRWGNRICNLRLVG